MSINATVYLQIEPVWSYDGSKVVGGKVVRYTQKPPLDSQRGGTVLVKLALALPESAFDPLEPPLVEVPIGFTHAEPGEAMAVTLDE